MSKIIFITGASRGFGKLWTEALLNRGDKVIATSRDLSNLQDLVDTYGDNIYTIKLDVNDRAAVFAALKKGKAHFGRIDTVINNAGYGLFGAVEETSEKDARDQFETNFFGLLWVTQAAIPILREQGHGHIVQVSSALGVVGLPTLSVYNASKFAVEGLTESLAPEVAQFGIKLTLLEPNAFATDWAGPSAVQTKSNPLYDQLKQDVFGSFPEDFYGKPEATTYAVLKLIDAENPPLRLFIGKIAHPFVKQGYESRWAEWDAWKEVSDAAHGV